MPIPSLVSWQSAVWRPAADFPRSFVRYKHPEPSPGSVWWENAVAGDVRVTIAIPTSDAYRQGYFAQLLEQLSRQAMSEYELIVVRGDPRQGRAINIAASLARGKYFLILDDDTSLPDTTSLAKLAAALDAHPDIGLAGGNNVIPEQAGSFVRRVMQQIPRRSWMPVEAITDSDLAEHPCLMMRTEEFKAVGGENELLPRGLDPYLRQAFRETGKRVVVVPGVVYSHLPPATWKGLLRQFIRNGRQAAFVNRHYPQWVIETPADHGLFQLRVPFWQRALRFPFLLLSALLTGKPVWCVCEIAYAIGFLQERWFPNEDA
jgi:hypothetical protein